MLVKRTDRLRQYGAKESSCSVPSALPGNEGENVPAWSPEIANELIALAAGAGRAFDQMQLQELVYIAHGWCLALTGEPLTGDRPEALAHGPDYRRLSGALARWGVEPVTVAIQTAGTNGTRMDATHVRAELLPSEYAILSKVFAEYGNLQTAQLASLTRASGTPWEQVYAGGAGNGRDIPHKLIGDQFAQFAAEFGSGTTVP